MQRTESQASAKQYDSTQVKDQVPSYPRGATATPGMFGKLQVVNHKGGAYVSIPINPAHSQMTTHSS